MIKEYLRKEISTPIAIGIILVLVILVGGFTWWQYAEIRKDEANIPEVKAPEIGAKNCVSDEVCVVFGEDGDCNCGCFNKNHNWEAEGACFCAAPSSCECVEGKCEDVFGEDETTGWKTYRNEEIGFKIRYPGFEIRYPQNLCVQEGYESVEFMDCEALEKPESYSPRVIIGIYVLFTELSPREWLKGVSTEEDLGEELPYLSGKCSLRCLFSSMSEIKDIHINNTPALQFHAWLGGTDGTIVLIKKSPETLIETVNFNTGIGVKGFSETIFNQMLSTFKFLD